MLKRDLEVLFLIVSVTSSGWLLGSPVAAAPAKVERLEIVDRSIQYHGGERYSHSETSLQVCSRSGCYRVSAKIDGGLYELEAAGEVRGVKRRIRATNDSLRRWKDGALVPTDRERQRELRDWVMARVYFCFLPFRLNDGSVFKEDQGIEVWEGRLLHRVKVTFAAGSSSDADDEYLFWFDPESGRVEQFAYSFSGNPGGLRFRRAFNYRRVGGILFFDQENWGIDAPDLSIDQMNAEFVRSLGRVSTVELEDIRVELLAD